MSRHKLDLKLKEWLDQVIIPALARDYLDTFRKEEEEDLASGRQRREDAEAQESLVEVVS